MVKRNAELIGVRAYTTNDGVGDAGAVGTIELRQLTYQSHYVGVFYDGGVIKSNKSLIPGACNAGYSLPLQITCVSTAR